MAILFSRRSGARQPSDPAVWSHACASKCDCVPVWQLAARRLEINLPPVPVPSHLGRRKRLGGCCRNRALRRVIGLISVWGAQRLIFSSMSLRLRYTLPRRYSPSGPMMRVGVGWLRRTGSKRELGKAEDRAVHIHVNRCERPDGPPQQVSFIS